jgi:hypothetical protein
LYPSYSLIYVKSSNPFHSPIPFILSHFPNLWQPLCRFLEAGNIKSKHNVVYPEIRVSTSRQACPSLLHCAYHREANHNLGIRFFPLNSEVTITRSHYTSSPRPPLFRERWGKIDSVRQRDGEKKKQTEKNRVT